MYLRGSGETTTHGSTDTYDITGADVLQVFDWAQRQAGESLTYAVALVYDDQASGRSDSHCSIRSCRCPDGQTTGVSDKTRAEVAGQLRRAIAWEVEAQVGVERPIEQMPPLIADTVLDYFDVSLKAGADISDRG